MKKKYIISIIILFIIVSAAAYVLKDNEPEFNMAVLMTGNIVMAVLSLLTYLIVTGQARKNPAAFVRGVSASTFIKLMVCAGSILIYVMVQKSKGIHKPSLYALLGIYVIYTITETWLLTRHVRNIK